MGSYANLRALRMIASSLPSNDNLGMCIVFLLQHNFGTEGDLLQYAPVDNKRERSMGRWYRANALTSINRLKAIGRITRLSRIARERIETGQYELECHYPEGAERLSIALSDLDKLEAYAVRVICGLPQREKPARGRTG